MAKMRKPKIPYIFALFGWCIAIAGGFIIAYATWFEVGDGRTGWNKIQKIMYGTFTTPGWGICICWVIWACHNGYGSFINQFLSIRHFIPISRLGYGIYLIHWVVMTFYFYTQEYKRYFMHVNVVSYPFLFKLN